MRNAGAQHLFLEVGGQLQRHELADGDAVGGLPGRDVGFEEPELGRAATARAGVHLGQPGVDASGIGAERGLGVIVLRGHGFDRERVEVEAPEQLVDPDGTGAEKLGQAALRGAPEHGHLPEPVLGVGKAEAEIDIGIRFAEDMRHGGVVAHDLDRARDAGDGEGFGIIGNRARKEPVEQYRGREAQHQDSRYDPEKPAK